MNEEIKEKRIGNIYGSQWGTGYAGNVWDKDYLCPTLTTVTGGGRQPMIMETDMEEKPEIRIRKLTPLECWRLMGFDDESFHRAEEVNSNSQLYKQAGNSIVVDVLMHIFKQML